MLTGVLLANGTLNASVLNSLYNENLVKEGVSAAFAVKLFKSWINEKDINAVAASLRKVSMDNRLMVCDFSFFTFLTTLKENVPAALPFLICEKRESVFLFFFCLMI